MRKILLLSAVSAAYSLVFTSCDKSNMPGPVYQLTAEEKAWQGYQQGQQLRFSRAGSSQVRTYLIVEVDDRLEEQYQSVWITPVQGKLPRYQHITVKGYRTDSVIYTPVGFANPRDSARAVDTFLDLQKYMPRADPSTTILLSEVGWDHWFIGNPQLQAVTTNQPLSVSGNVELLPSITLGGISYGPTLRIKRAYVVYPAPRQRIISQIWYAKGVGVVGYEELGTGLWYRLR
ncbi:hypothetical protein GCM10023172_40980 [Hymenobacter ginsengisoli]|uniref:Uncharacterized protein n=1 Tax=Hymenobacter ginsengisoli TaxID=1051626 RepID=A0ABP8QQA9_9BACT|nr:MULTISPECIES: hypothetical protein [unclassified Hymenobacter]MBO2032258.1 hypothetical protein [Hymenobacter sp. BT559]